MASSFITNTLQVNFDSVLGIHDNEGMVRMFRALEATGLRGFLGCPFVLYEQELEQFFDTTFVQDGDVVCAVSGKFVAIYEDSLQATLFYKTGVPVQFSCKKRLMKYEFRLLNDILANSITVKAGSFDVVTHERFLMMTAIHFGIKVMVRCGWYQQVTPKSNAQVGLKLIVKYFKEKNLCVAQKGRILPELAVVAKLQIKARKS
ncbi:protease Do-like 12, mitochondrial [Dorcoceras hygrometricum]|uniref:Protease Do-like 12, mitochondrial n=1 Tax=Dorcoceras hygrometricum TaxID=472368 RepID=A0A2Z7APD1_9LAMI|nr:protease Do-like 12, mitochondrial [Dorcoceras hygrometricum]